MPQTLRDLTNGTIGQPYRSPPMQAVGTLADLVNYLAAQADRVGFTIPESSPVMGGQGMTLKDMTVGDLGNVLENISYGMGPMRGGNYATGGLGTLGQMHPQVLELANALPAAAVAGKAIRRAGDILTKKKE
jgi:hypothetical protein